MRVRSRSYVESLDILFEEWKNVEIRPAATKLAVWFYIHFCFILSNIKNIKKFVLAVSVLINLFN